MKLWTFYGYNFLCFCPKRFRCCCHEMFLCALHTGLTLDVNRLKWTVFITQIDGLRKPKPYFFSLLWLICCNNFFLFLGHKRCSHTTYTRFANWMKVEERIVQKSSVHLNQHMSIHGLNEIDAVRGVNCMLYSIDSHNYNQLFITNIIIIMGEQGENRKKINSNVDKA